MTQAEAEKQRVADLTMNELQQIITTRVKLQLEEQQPPQPNIQISREAFRKMLRENVIRMPPGTPTTTQLLREDRDR